MVFSRIVLGITGLAFASYGVYCALDLDFVVRITGIAFRSPTGAVEARAMYGGLQTGLGLLFINAAVNRRLTAYGLVAMIFVLGGLALGRALGLSLERIDEYNTWALVYESVSTLLAAFALWRERRVGSAALFD
jgi:hypothetical protein